jgi:hypothetical protein
VRLWSNHFRLTLRMSDLGKLIRTHRGQAWRHLGPAIIAGLITIGGIYAIAVMDGPEPGKAALFVLALAAITVLFIVLAIRDSNSRLVFHELGIVYVRGGTETTVRYRDIRAVRERQVNGKHTDLILELRNGGEVSIPTSFENYEHAAQTIAESA